MSPDDLQTIPARSGRAQRLEAGQSITVINTHGTQVLDTWAFAAGDLGEYLSMEHTRSVNSRWLVGPGMVFVSTKRRPMLTLVEDRSPGVHDMLLPACSPEIYRELGCADGHASCQNNLHTALAAVGLAVPITPAPLNLFMNVPITADGALDRVPPTARPGDAVVLRAEMPLWIVFSACPQDVTPINGALRQPVEAHYRLG
ncbi:DUF1989 domain-containing protein [Roseomonas elaeocarpi]|uniref:DUF1989 domain-containing protein n=1 Tax=Roseomonas elaeocarpi TaxID=907779 RepID=A0ABV6JWY1_9PROT